MKKQILAVICTIALLMSGTSNSNFAQAVKKPVSLSKKSIVLKVGQSRKLKVKKAAKVKIKRKTFHSSNKKVAVVTKKTGKIRAKKEGKATITVKVDYVRKSKKRKNTVLKCKVKVKNKDMDTTMLNTASPTDRFLAGGNGTEISQKPEVSARPTDTSAMPTDSTLLPTSPVPIPEKSGLYDASGNVKKSWEKLVEDGDVEITADGTLNEFNISLSGILVIPETVTYIWCSAFMESKLIGLGIPGSVVHLGDKENGFFDCTNLVSVRLGEGMESIASDTFYGCSNLRNVDLPDSMKSIGSGAFYDCSKLAEINFSSNINEIGGLAFEGTSWLKTQQQKKDFVVVNNILIRNGRSDHGEVVLPDGIEGISEEAFYGCKDLKGITVPDGVQSIGGGAFRECENLSNVVLPESVHEVGMYVFEDTFWLKTNTQKDFAIANHVLISCRIKKSGNIELPDNITVIAGGAFADCEDIVNVDLPENLLCIGDYAFADCSSLKQINFPADIKKIGNCAFSGCKNLSVEIPEHIDYIGDYAFSYCERIVSITIPADVTLGCYVFHSCRNLSEVMIEYGRKELSEGLFSFCESLKNISLPSSITSIGAEAFEESGLTGIDLPYSIDNIGMWAFSDCENLIQIQVPDRVSQIGSYAFRGIPLVLYSGNAVGSPWGADMVLQDKESLQAGLYDSKSGKLKLSWEELIQKDYIRVEDGVLIGNVGNEDWANEDVIEALDGYLIISDTITEIGDYAFGCCEFLTSAYIPKSVSRIGADAFCYCTHLRSVVISEGVTDIGENTFLYCSRLSKISIPDSVKYIGERAFAGCDLYTIYVPVNVAMIGEDAFEDIFIVVYDGGYSEGSPWGAKKVQNSSGVILTPVPTQGSTVAPTATPGGNKVTPAPGTQKDTKFKKGDKEIIVDDKDGSVYPVTISDLNETTWTSESKRPNMDPNTDGKSFNRDGSVSFTSLRDYNSGVCFYLNPCTDESQLEEYGEDGCLAYRNGDKDMSAYDYIRMKVTCENELNLCTYNGGEQFENLMFPGSSASKTYECGWFHTTEENIWEEESVFTAGNTVKPEYVTRTIFIPVSSLAEKGCDLSALTAIGISPQGEGVDVRIHYIDFVKVKYNTKVTGIEVTSDKTEIALGKSAQCKASVTPGDATRSMVAWSSSDEKVATVNFAGFVVAKKAGKVTITAKATDGSKIFDSVNITVKDADIIATPTPNYEPEDNRIKTVVEDFESYDVGYNWESDEYKGTSGKATKGKEYVNSNVGKMTVVQDPEDLKNKCLKIEYTNGDTQAYDYAPIFDLKMPKTLGEYSGVMVQSRIVASNTGDPQYKTVAAYFSKYQSITPEYYFASPLKGGDVTEKGISKELIKFSFDAPHATGKDEKYTVKEEVGSEFEGMVYNNKFFPMFYNDWSKEKKNENCTIGFKESENDTYKAGWHQNKLGFNKRNITENGVLTSKNFSMIIGSTYAGAYGTKNASLTLYLDNLTFLEDVIPCTEVKIENPPAKVAKGMKMKFSTDNVSYVPDTTTQTQIIWSSSDKKVLKVDGSKNDPVFEGVATGKATVTATLVDNPAIKKCFEVEVYEPTKVTSDLTIDLSSLDVLKKKADDDKTTKVYSTMDKAKKDGGVLSLEFTQANNDRYVLDMGKTYDLSSYQGFSVVGTATEQMTLEFYPDTANFQEDKYWTKQVAFATFPFFEGSHAHRSHEGTSYGDAGVEETFILNWYDGTDAKGNKVEGSNPSSNLTNARYIVLKANKFNDAIKNREYKLKTLTFRKDWYDNPNPTDKEVDAKGGDSRKGIWFE